MRRSFVALVMLVFWLLPTRATAQWGGSSGGGVPPRGNGGTSRGGDPRGSGTQAIRVGDWYYVAVRVAPPRDWSDEDVDEICAEANRVWRVAKIGFSFTRQGKRWGVNALATFDLSMRGAAGLYTGGGRVQVDPTLNMLARGRVLAHELGHYLGLENLDDNKALMGPLSDANKSGIKLSDREISSARATAKRLAGER